MEVPRTESDTQPEVLPRMMVLLALHCMLHVVGPPDTVAEVMCIVVGPHMALLQQLPAAAGGVR